MREDFLHFIWQFQHFSTNNLHTTDGHALEIHQKGFPNDHAGADFKECKVCIDGVSWAGDVEIHLKSSHWKHHRHDANPQYNTVVLHVVWEDDMPVYRADQTRMPTLVLKGRVDPHWLYQYQRIMSSKDPIPCAGQMGDVREITKQMVLDRALMHRYEEKTFLFKALLRKNQLDWEESTYQLLAKNFGFHVNSTPFLRLSQSLPLKYLRKHQDAPLQVEALLFGQAGFLDQEHNDAYFLELKREYAFLSNKYHVDTHKLDVSAWNFLRLRPANFPERRIAQFAALLMQEKNLFSSLLERSPDALKKKFSVLPSSYWQKHYGFAKTTASGKGALGAKSIENILINTVAVVLIAYAKEHRIQKYTDKALDLLETIKAENNSIIRMWETLGYAANTALDTQGLLGLYHYFCTSKKCLSCGIGLEIMKKSAPA